MKPHFFYFLVFAVILFACQKDTIERNLTGSLSLILQLDDDKARMLDNHLKEAHSLLISIKKENGEMLWQNKMLELMNINDQLIVPPVTLPAGKYVITQLGIVDKDNSIIYAVPHKDSYLAGYVNQPLPVHISIENDKDLNMEVQLLSTEEFEPADFGFISFNPEVIETLPFSVVVFAFNYVENNYKITTAKFKLYNNQKLVVKKLLKAEISQIILPEFPNYNMVIEKSGFAPLHFSLSMAEINEYQEEPLKIYLLDQVTFWHQFNSKEDIQKSKIGPELQLLNYKYQSWEEAKICEGKEGMGLYVNHDTKEGWNNDGANFFAFNMKDAHLSPEKGAIEFWFKFDYDASVRNHAYFFRSMNDLLPHFPNNQMINDFHIAAGWNGWTYYGNTGKRFFFSIGHFEPHGSTIGGIPGEHIIFYTDDNSAAPNGKYGFKSGELMHFAFVWDINGIENSQQTARIYVNHELAGASDQKWNTTAAMDEYLYIGSSPNYSGWDHWYNAVKGVTDEFKVWNFAQTDF